MDVPTQMSIREKEKEQQLKEWETGLWSEQQHQYGRMLVDEVGPFWNMTIEELCKDQYADMRVLSFVRHRTKKNGSMYKASSLKTTFWSLCGALARVNNMWLPHTPRLQRIGNMLRKNACEEEPQRAPAMTTEEWIKAMSTAPAAVKETGWLAWTVAARIGNCTGFRIDACRETTTVKKLHVVDVTWFAHKTSHLGGAHKVSIRWNMSAEQKAAVMKKVGKQAAITRQEAESLGRFMREAKIRMHTCRRSALQQLRSVGGIDLQTLRLVSLHSSTGTLAAYLDGAIPLMENHDKEEYLTDPDVMRGEGGKRN